MIGYVNITAESGSEVSSIVKIVAHKCGIRLISPKSLLVSDDYVLLLLLLFLHKPKVINAKRFD